MTKEKIDANLRHATMHAWNKDDDVAGIYVFFYRDDMKGAYEGYAARCFVGPGGKPANASAEAPIDSLKADFDFSEKYFTKPIRQKTQEEIEQEIAQKEAGKEKKELQANIKKYANYDAQYRISCSESISFDLTYHNKDGGTEQKNDVLIHPGIPYFIGFNAKEGTFLYISAQIQGRFGSVTVEIYKKGKLFKKATSSGAFAIASVSGSL
jgi:hypothetical protein